MTLFLVGLVSLLAQVVLLRELNVAFYGIELAYLLGLAAWMAGTAAGAALVPRRLSASRAGVAALLAACALALPALVAFTRASRLLLNAVPGAYLPIERQLVVLLVCLVPLAFLSGVAFRWAAALHVASGGALAGAYALESAGAAVAGLASTLAFRAGVQTLAMAIATSIAGLAFVAWLFAARRRIAVASLLLAGGLALGQSSRIDRATTRWTHPLLVAVRDTPYARVTVSRSGSQVSVFENDVLAYESETAANEELPHLAALQHPSPGRVLLLGGTVERIDRELAKHHPLALHAVEMDRAMLTAIDQSTDTPSQTRVFIADPRAFLSKPAVGSGRGGRPAGGGPYDLIVVAMPEPVSGQANRFYTREFFRACARRLAPAGILGFRLNVPENYLSPLALLQASSIAGAVRASFPYAEYLPASRAVIVASREPLPAPETVVERLRQRELDTRLVTPLYVQYLYQNDRRADLATALGRTRALVNRDAQPIAYLYAAGGWISKFVPTLIGVDTASIGVTRQWPWRWKFAPFAALALLFAASRARPGMRRPAVAAAAGFAGMCLETLVVLGYQAESGALFEDLGFLVMAFMAGSAAGAWMAGRRRHRIVLPLLAALSLLGAGCGLLTAWEARLGLADASALLFAVGGVVAAIFATVSQGVESGGEGKMGRLYGADLLGGCAGSLAASLLLVPLAGLDATGYTVAIVSLLAIIAA